MHRVEALTADFGKSSRYVEAHTLVNKLSVGGFMTDGDDDDVSSVQMVAAP